MIKTNKTNCLFIRLLLGEALPILSREDRGFSIMHIYREANRCADFLANLGHSGPFEFDYSELHATAPLLQPILVEDARGMSFKLTKLCHSPSN